MLKSFKISLNLDMFLYFIILVLTVQVHAGSNEYLQTRGAIENANAANNVGRMIARRRLSRQHKMSEADKYSNISWSQMSKDSYDPNRLNLVKEALKSVGGIYGDREMAKKIGVEKYVLVNVLQLQLHVDKTSQNLKYLHLLQNWYCYANKHGLKPLTYIVPSYEKTFEEQVKDFSSLGITGTFLPYPNSLFWSIVAQKSTSILGGPQRVSYAGTLPTFKHFGALVMVVPLLEILELGYHTIYFDLDISFVRDPIPHMIRGDADFVTSLEMKTCLCPSAIEVGKHQDWLKTEPNTGVLLVRSTPKGIDFFKVWLAKIVNDNTNNDQKVLYFDQFGSKLTFSCNANLDQYSNSELSKYLLPNRTSYHQHCFLNEFLFQNGKVGFQCAKGQGGSLSDYVLGMNDQNFTAINPNTGKEDKTMAPVLIHGNYCQDKIEEFKNLGLWIAPENADGFSNVNMQCKNYNLNQTVFYNTDWKNTLAKAEADIAEVKSKFANNSLVRLFRKPQIYLVRDGVLHPFPTPDTILAMGYTWSQVNHLRAYNFIKFVPVAPQELPELTLAPSPAKPGKRTRRALTIKQ